MTERYDKFIDFLSINYRFQFGSINPQELGTIACILFPVLPVPLGASVYLQPHLFWVTIRLFVLNTFVECDLVAHFAPDFVDSVVVTIAQEVVI